LNGRASSRKGESDILAKVLIILQRISKTETPIRIPRSGSDRNIKINDENILY
jgi:hypothetical protein